MNKIISRLKKAAKILMGRELDSRIQVAKQVEWFGITHAGFYVCTENLNENSIVYSFGVGDNIAFDEDLINRFHCNVYGFDPTPKSVEYIKKKKPQRWFKFFEYGISYFDGIIKFYLPKNPDHVSCATFNRWGYDEAKNRPIEVPVKKLSTISKELGHSKINVLKFDIEGSEYDILDDVLSSDLEIDQILIEFHHRFKAIGIDKTKTAIRGLNHAGYKIAAISDTMEEYTFVKV